MSFQGMINLVSKNIYEENYQTGFIKQETNRDNTENYFFNSKKNLISRLETISGYPFKKLNWYIESGGLIICDFYTIDRVGNHLASDVDFFDWGEGIINLYHNFYTFYVVDYIPFNSEVLSKEMGLNIKD